jgi:hypothetical protein
MLVLKQLFAILKARCSIAVSGVRDRNYSAILLKSIILRKFKFTVIVLSVVECRNCHFDIMLLVIMSCHYSKWHYTRYH